MNMHGDLTSGNMNNGKRSSRDNLRCSSLDNNSSRDNLRCSSPGNNSRDNVRCSNLGNSSRDNVRSAAQATTAETTSGPATTKLSASKRT
jgi:hypothetical protein